MKLWVNTVVLFQTRKFVLICYSNNRRLIYLITHRKMEASEGVISTFYKRPISITVLLPHSSFFLSRLYWSSRSFSSLRPLLPSVFWAPLDSSWTLTVYPPRCILLPPTLQTPSYQPSVMFSLPQKETLYPLATSLNFPISFSPKQPVICFMSLKIGLFWTFQINGVILYVVFCDWLCSFSLAWKTKDSSKL